MLPDDSDFGTLLTIAFPLLEIEATLDVNGATSREVLRGKLGEAAPEGDIDKSDLFDLFIVRTLADAIHGESEIRDGGTLRSVTQFGIAGEIPDEVAFIK